MFDNFVQKFRVYLYIGVLLLIGCFSVHELLAKKTPPIDAFYTPDIVPHFRDPEDVASDDDIKEKSTGDKELDEFRRQIRDMV